MERERDILTSVFFEGVLLGFLIAQLCFGPQEVCDFNGLLFFCSATLQRARFRWQHFATLPWQPELLCPITRSEIRLAPTALSAICGFYEDLLPPRFPPFSPVFLRTVLVRVLSVEATKLEMQPARNCSSSSGSSKEPTREWLEHHIGLESTMRMSCRKPTRGASWLSTYKKV